MKRISARITVSCLLIASVLLQTLTVTASQPVSVTFNTAIRNEFVNFLRWAHREDYWEYDRFALHDFDGDGIPEVLMGMTDPNNPMFASYSVVKFPNNGLENANFKVIGTISNSRYLMSDKFSGAVLGLYGSPVNAGDTTEINNFYISNAIVQKNNVLRRIGSSYTRYSIPITSQEFNLELYNYFGTYTEIVTHDSFTRSVIESVVFNWQPNKIATGNVARISNTTELNKSWQKAFDEVIKNTTAPYPTMFEPYALSEPERLRYSRYALFDFDSDQVPELLIGVMHGTKYSFDVYKYLNGSAKFAGSFDSYTLMLRYFNKTDHLFCLDPQPELINYEEGIDYYAVKENPTAYIYDRNSLIFHFENVNAVYYANGLSQIGLMSIFPSDSDTTVPVYKNKANPSISAVNNRKNTMNYALVGDDGIINEEDYLTKIRNYSSITSSVPTYDIFIAPPSAVFTTWRPLN